MRVNRRNVVWGVICAAQCCFLSPCMAQDPPPVRDDKPAVQENSPPQVDDQPVKLVAEDSEWRSLFPKEGLGLWEVTDFGPGGTVRTEGDEWVLEAGEPLTGINLKKPAEFPRNDFEIELQCKRVEGSDFLCGLTFPVGEEYCSFIAGGWGGGLVGLSSINGMDASENSTSSYIEFKNGEWYKFRVRVDDTLVQAWIDDKEVIRQEREHYKFSTRIEVSVSQPLGLSAFRSMVAVKDFRWRALKAPAAAGTPSAENPAGGAKVQAVKPIE